MSSKKPSATCVAFTVPVLFKYVAQIFSLGANESDFLLPHTCFPRLPEQNIPTSHILKPLASLSINPSTLVCPTKQFKQLGHSQKKKKLKQTDGCILLQNQRESSLVEVPVFSCICKGDVWQGNTAPVLGQCFCCLSSISCLISLGINQTVVAFSVCGVISTVSP